MKEIALSLFKCLTVSIFILGVSMGEAAEKTWVSVNDTNDQMKAAFPHAPIEMSFDIPFQNTPAHGRLHVYSCATQTGVFLLCALSAPDLNLKLEKESFKKTFENLLVPRLFYYPQLLKKQQTYMATKKDERLNFRFTYQDKTDTRVLQGISSVKGSILYTLIYIATEAHFNPKEWEKFEDSFSEL